MDQNPQELNCLMVKYFLFYFYGFLCVIAKYLRMCWTTLMQVGLYLVVLDFLEYPVLLACSLAILLELVSLPMN